MLGVLQFLQEMFHYFTASTMASFHILSKFPTHHRNISVLCNRIEKESLNRDSTVWTPTYTLAHDDIINLAFLMKEALGSIYDAPFFFVLVEIIN